MVFRIAAIFGESITLQRANTLAATIVGGMALRYLAMEGAKFIPGPGWLAAAALAGIGTWAIGQVVVQYFEGGKAMSEGELQGSYRRWFGGGRNNKRGART